jgi:hypothetical protein
MTQYTLIDGVAYPIAEDAPAQAPVVSAPTQPKAASPFSTLVAGKAVTERWPEPLATYARNAPVGLASRVVREAAAFEAVPGYSCDAITRTLSLPRPDGTSDARDVGHGFTVAKKSGEPCATAGCTGKIR